jgi:uncharacterized membrane protein YjgN (DUF898 family)
MFAQNPDPLTDPVPAAQPQGIEFTGQGGEYFRIWIVNLALTIVTLGIYSAWAKVRRLQYFHRNTSLFGSAFDYHGDPMVILKGRLIAIALLVAYNFVSVLSVGLGIGAFVLLLVALPWLVQRSICFKLANSSYRGLRFHFKGDLRGAYRVFLGWTVLGYLSLGLLFPLAHQRMKAYLHGNSTFGTAPFAFAAEPRRFYGIYLRMLGLIIGAIAAFAALAAVLGAFEGLGAGRRSPAFERATAFMFVGIVVLYMLIFAAIGPWFAARLQNLVWNNTSLAGYRFHSAVRARDLFLIYLTNFIGIALTLGLYKPFADIRLMRYRLTHMAMDRPADLDSLIAREQDAINATGEETADVFDVDISF